MSDEELVRALAFRASSRGEVGGYAVGFAQGRFIRPEHLNQRGLAALSPKPIKKSSQRLLFLMVDTNGIEPLTVRSAVGGADAFNDRGSAAPSRVPSAKTAPVRAVKLAALTPTSRRGDSFAPSI